jgi:hypothetical protein
MSTRSPDDEADEKLEITSTNTPYNTYWTKMKCVVKSVKHGDIDSKDSRNEKSHWFRELSPRLKG